MKKTFVRRALVAARLAGISSAFVGVAMPSAAQDTPSDTLVSVAAQYSSMIDEAARASRRTDFNADSGTPLLTNPYYYPLFANTTLLTLPLSYTLGRQSSTLPAMPTPFSGSASLLRSVPAMSHTLLQTYSRLPWMLRYNLAAPDLSFFAPEDTEPAAPSLSTAETHKRATDTAHAPQEVSEQEVIRQESPLDLSDFHIHVRRPNFWKIKGSFSTQFMQYYVSDNWYKGGENHVSVLGAFNIEANYDNKQKLTFSNKLETKLGFQTSPSDSYHSFKTNADLLRLTNKLGLQAHKRWYYTIMLQSWSQFCKSYKANSPETKSNFASPLESVLSIGMDYKLEKPRVVLNVNIAPAAVDFKYCKSDALVGDHIRDALHPSRHYKLDIGSTLTANMTLKICKQVNWQSRFYAFYNYKTDVNNRRDQIKWEWENTINLKVNKYLSSKIFLFPRYEGGLKPNRTDPDTGETIGTRTKLQFNEYLSVGLDLNF